MKRTLFFAMVLLALGACSPVTIQVSFGPPTATPSAIPSATASPVSTSTATFTATPLPTWTDTPFPTRAPFPSATPTSPARAALVEWGKGIGSIEKEESIVARDLTLWYDRNKGSASDAAINEYKSLVDRYLALLNQVERLPRPPEAREVHNEYLDTYSGLYDATRFFYDYLRQNDNSLYDRSVASIRAVNKIASKASDDLWALMGKYGIVCTEIKMCKSDFATPTPQPVQAAAPTTTPEFPKIPAGMGGFIVVNYYGDPMTITIGGTLYDIAANGRQVIFLPPGRHTYSCNWGNKGWYTKEVDIVLGQYRILSFAD